jgi:hypothetical protein
MNRRKIITGSDLMRQASFKWPTEASNPREPTQVEDRAMKGNLIISAGGKRSICCSAWRRGGNTRSKDQASCRAFGQEGDKS